MPLFNCVYRAEPTSEITAPENNMMVKVTRSTIELRQALNMKIYDAVPALYPTPRTVRIIFGSSGSTSTFARSL